MPLTPGYGETPVSDDEHPFTDGHGRVTRLLADLVFIAAQDADAPELYG